MLSHGLLNYSTFKLFYLSIVCKSVLIDILATTNVNIGRDLHCTCGRREASVDRGIYY